MLEAFEQLMQRGGPVMWPLLAMSVVSMTLLLERGWFFFQLSRASRLRHAAAMARLLRAGDRVGAARLAEGAGGVYAELVRQLAAERMTEALAIDAVESRRYRLERFMPTLSTIITAAPMVGILGTVLGIIASFRVLSSEAVHTDPALVSQGIAEALITTAVGLVVAVGTLFPYNAMRAQIDRALSRMESLVAAALVPVEVADAKSDRAADPDATRR